MSNSKTRHRKWWVVSVLVVMLAGSVDVSLAQAPQRTRFDSIQHVDEVVVTSRYNHKEVIP